MQCLIVINCYAEVKKFEDNHVWNSAYSNMKYNSQKAKGAFYGTLIGDALGAPVEFKRRGQFPWVSDMLPCMHFQLEPGSFTDDGSLMLCLAAALIHSEGTYDPYTALCHYLEWLRKGYMSVNGRMFDVGNTTERALTRFSMNGDIVANTTDDDIQAGNGSLMRIAPIPILFGHDLVQTWRIAADESATTHACASAIWCCRLWSVLTALAIQGQTKEKLLAYVKSVGDAPRPCEVITRCGFLKATRETVGSSGWVVDSVSASLWAFFTTDTFEAGLIEIVNLGGDADTNGAVFGTLAGAFYGYDAIPERWMTALQQKEMVGNVWNEFNRLAEQKWGSLTE